MATVSQILTQVYDLLIKVVYIAQLLDLSVTIPSEYSLGSYGNFQIYTTRTSDEDVTVDLDDVSVTIDGDDTSGGRDDFGDTDEDLNSVDVVIISIPTSGGGSEVTIIDEAKCSSDGTLSEDSVSINVVGDPSDENTNTLSNNVSITFNGHDGTQSSVCVWFNDETSTWESSGCLTKLNETSGKISCDCSHLTTFAVIESINDKCGDLRDAFEKSKEWNIVHILFAIAFSFIFLFVVYRLLELRRYGAFQKHKVIYAMSLIALLAFLQIWACVDVVLLGSAYEVNHANVEILTVILLLPLLFYFVIFSCVLYAWMMVSHALDVDTSVVERLKIVLIVVNVIATLFFIVVIAMLLAGIENYFLGQIALAFLMWLSTVAFIWYGYGMVRVLKKSARRLSMSRRRATSEDRTLIRLKRCAIVFCCFFLFQASMISYLSIYPEKLSLGWRVADLTSNVMVLCVLIVMYLPTLERMKMEGMSEIGSQTGNVPPSSRNSRQTRETRQKKRNSNTLNNASSSGIRVESDKIGRETAMSNETVTTYNSDGGGEGDEERDIISQPPPRKPKGSIATLIGSIRERLKSTSTKHESQRNVEDAIPRGVQLTPLQITRNAAIMVPSPVSSGPLAPSSILPLASVSPRAQPVERQFSSSSNDSATNTPQDDMGVTSTDFGTNHSNSSQGLPRPRAETEMEMETAGTVLMGNDSGTGLPKLAGEYVE